MKTALKRFEEKVEKTDTCWLWTGAKTNGYGQIKKEGESKLDYAHRFSYETYRGPIPEGFVIDHLCRVRACVNPDHLEVVTNKMNIHRGVGLTAQNVVKTHCKRGHPFDEENTMHKPKGRTCKACYNGSRRDFYYRQKGIPNPKPPGYELLTPSPEEPTS